MMSYDNVKCGLLWFFGQFCFLSFESQFLSYGYHFSMGSLLRILTSFSITLTHADEGSTRPSTLQQDPVLVSALSTYSDSLPFPLLSRLHWIAVSWVSESLTPGSFPSHMETSPSTCSLAPLPHITECVFAAGGNDGVPSGRDTEGKLLPQEEISDSSAVFMWLFFLGGRRYAAGERETGRKGKTERAGPRLLANLRRRGAAHSFAPSNRNSSCKTIPGNLLFLLPTPPQLFFFQKM